MNADINQELDTYMALRKQLLTESSLAKSKKPILWIHVPYEYNARSWINFGSRSSHDLNQPYLFLTVKTIIKNCSESFKIVIIDDHSFKRLLPDWEIDLSRAADPVKGNLRKLGLAKLIYHYGGVQVPISFLCFRDLASMFYNGTKNDRVFICENVNRKILSTHYEFSPDVDFYGAKKNNPTIHAFIDFLQRNISGDSTAESSFLGESDRWFNARIKLGEVKLINGKEVGTMNMEDEPILIDDLLSEKYLELYSNAYGVWIPAEQVLKRRHYEWFARMSPEQIMRSRFILAKYILLASAPDSKVGVIEPLDNKPDWVGFWKVPGYDGLYGLKPNNLGNNLRKVPYPGA